MKKWIKSLDLDDDTETPTGCVVNPIISRVWDKNCDIEDAIKPIIKVQEKYKDITIEQIKVISPIL